MADKVPSNDIFEGYGLDPSGPTDRCLALLRGVNVGGSNKLLMKDLKRIFEEAGAQNVSTHIQSGNVIFHSNPRDLDEIKNAVHDGILNHLRKPIPVVYRSRQELDEALDLNPFFDPVIEDPSLYVMFLQDSPPSALIEMLDPNRSPGDEFRVIGSHIFMRLATGAAKTKLTNAYFDGKLKTVSTSRNWKVAQVLGRLMKSQD